VILGAASPIRFDVVAIGVMAGLGYAVLASGLVLVYRATRVINLAHGQIGAFSAVAMMVLVYRVGLPYPLAFVAAVACGAGIGAVIERGLVRPLLTRSRLAILVATIGVTQMLIVAQAQLPDVIGERFPVPFELSATVSSLSLHGEHFTILLLAPLVLGAFTLFLNRSRYGLAVRGVADNRDAAQLAGVNADHVSRLVWMLAGGLGAIAAILTVPLSGATFGSGPLIALGPGLLLRALAAGLVGRLTNLPATVAAGLAIGVTESVLFAAYPDDLGAVDLVLFIAVVGILVLRRGFSGAQEPEESFGEEPEPLPDRVRNHPSVRRLRRTFLATAMVVAVLAPLVYSTSSDLYLLSRVPVFAIIGISIVVLTGWAGQLSLGQMAFVGVGAMGTAALGSRGVPYGAAIGYVTVAGTLLAVVVGAPALRLRGLLLTVTTLGFAVASSSYLLTRDLFRSSTVDVAVVSPGALGPFDFDSFRTDYYLCLAALVGVALVARRLRSTGVGRTIIAVEGNEQSAAALTVSPAVAKLTAFALAGGLATFAGALLAGVSRSFQVDLFSPDQSLQVLAMTVVGGVGAIAGAIAGAIFIVGVPYLLGDSTTVRLATSGIGLLAILRFEPAGLVGLAHRPRDWVITRLIGADQPAGADGKISASDDSNRAGVVTLSGLSSGTSDEPSNEPLGPGPALATHALSVTIAGRRIVSTVDLELAHHEIVGLIGANGAGKSTLMNAISGFVPSEGVIELHGEPVNHLSASQRARLGLGRSFQTARLFPRLSVRECVQVALEAQRRSEFLPSMLALPPSVRSERWSRAAADDVIDLLGLGDRAEQHAETLSTGTRRVAEFACMLAMRPTVVLLDEPMAGIAQRETEAFAPLLLDIRRELGAAMLVIEHDLPMISSISDRLYCLEAGVVIAAGDVGTVRTDPKVIASYLGTDERSIARSGAMPGVRRRRRVPLKVGDVS
jgi:ABC-type branched-subunit amino acid transport system ATPase component/ABC-type branched-subunit amino acid transport system permease subunit